MDGDRVADAAEARFGGRAFDDCDADLGLSIARIRFVPGTERIRGFVY
jgi:hypothetical protein